MEHYGGVERICETFLQHPEYNSNTMVNDWGLCKLDSPVTIDQTKAKLELNQNPAVPADESACETMGMGLIQENPEEYPNTLQDITVNAISNEKCGEYYYGGMIPVDDNVLCTATPEGENICAGDSGGGLVQVQADGTHLHVGLASFRPAAGCGLPNVPSGFARISSGYDWIVDAACNELNSIWELCPTNAQTASPAPSAAPSSAPSSAPSGTPTKKSKKSKHSKSA